MNNTSECVLLIDGWKNTTNNTKNVTTMIHNSMDRKSFLDAWDFTSDPETGDALNDVLDEAYSKTEEMFHSKPYAVVS